MESSKEVLGLYEWLTLAAIVLGPIIGIFVTRAVDYLRDKKARRLELFKILMRTRGTRLNAEHVSALNLIEIEFYKERKVIESLEKYFDHLNSNTGSTPLSPPLLDAWIKNMDHLFTKLLYQIARSLGYEIEQLQILTGGYKPRGWDENEFREGEIQKGLLDIIKGRAPFPVFVTTQLPMAQASQQQDGQVSVAPPPGFPPPPV